MEQKVALSLYSLQRLGFADLSRKVIIPSCLLFLTISLKEGERGEEENTPLACGFKNRGFIYGVSLESKRASL